MRHTLESHNFFPIAAWTIFIIGVIIIVLLVFNLRSITSELGTQTNRTLQTIENDGVVPEA